MPGLPQVPTFQQAGIEGFDVIGWFGFFAPARMAPAIAEQLGAELTAAMQASGYRQFLDVALMAPGRERGAQFLDSVKNLDAYWRRLITANAIRVE